MDIINHYIAVLSTFNVSQAVGTIAIVTEFALRLIKTEKPLSIIYGASSVIHGIGNLFSALGTLLDKIIPQRLN